MTAVLDHPEIFTLRERKALQRIRRLPPSEWAETYRQLSRVESSRPGPCGRAG